MKVIMLNGPKLVGKDTAAKQFADFMNVNDTPSSAVILPMAKPMHLAALAQYGLTEKHYNIINERELKDVSDVTLDGLSPREVYIEYGTQLRRDKGEDVVADMWLVEAAQLFAKSVAEGLPEYLVVPDCRFLPEYDAACKLVGRQNVCLVRMYREGGGYDWKGDIGSWLTVTDTADLSLENHGLGKARLGEALSAIVHQWENGATYVSRYA